MPRPASGFVRSAAELAVGDVVRTPSGRQAAVLKHWADRVLLRYLPRQGDIADDDQVALKPEYLTLVRRAAASADGRQA